MAEARRLKRSFKRAKNEVYLTYKRAFLVRVIGLIVGAPIAALAVGLLVFVGILDFLTSIPEVAIKTVFKYTKAVLKKCRLKRKNRENKK